MKMNKLGNPNSNHDTPVERAPELETGVTLSSLGTGLIDSSTKGDAPLHSQYARYLPIML